MKGSKSQVCTYYSVSGSWMSWQQRKLMNFWYSRWVSLCQRDLIQSYQPLPWSSRPSDTQCGTHSNRLLVQICKPGLRLACLTCMLVYASFCPLRHCNMLQEKPCSSHWFRFNNLFSLAAHHTKIGRRKCQSLWVD